MSLLVLIPWPQTAWSDAGRITGRTPVPLNEAGRNRALAWGQELAGFGLRTIYSGDEPASTETARIIAKSSRARRKTLPGLAEVDAGLWDGLTSDELKRRYPKTFKRWWEDPAAVSPPEGEDLTAACRRLGEALAKVTDKRASHPVALVLGPLAFAVTRCVLEAGELPEVRSLMHDEPLCYELDESPRSAEPVLAPHRDGGLVPKRETVAGATHDGG